MKISRRTLLPMTALLVAALGLTACGSDDKTSTNTDSSSTKATTSSSKATADVAVKAAEVGDLGMILVDSGGRTVYTLTKDGANVPCTGDCLAAWPAVLLPVGTDTATGGPGVTGITAVSVTDGKQVASGGLPLYTFSGDQNAGDANGDGLESFGGVWKVVTVGAAGTSSNSTSSTTSDGYDPGY